MGRDAVFGHYLRDGEVKRFWRKAAAVRFFKKAIGDNESRRRSRSTGHPDHSTEIMLTDINLTLTFCLIFGVHYKESLCPIHAERNDECINRMPILSV